MSAPNYETMVLDVLVFLQESNGKKFRIGELAKIFKVPNTSMNVIISKLGIKVSLMMQTDRKFYYVMTDADRAELIRCTTSHKPPPVHAKPYVQPKAMTEALERCKELYPRDFGFISIS